DDSALRLRDIQHRGHVLHGERLRVKSGIFRRVALAVAADVPGDNPPVGGQGREVPLPHLAARRIAVAEQQGSAVVAGPGHLVEDADAGALEKGHRLSDCRDRRHFFHAFMLLDAPFRVQTTTRSLPGLRSFSLSRGPARIYPPVITACNCRTGNPATVAVV